MSITAKSLGNGQVAASKTTIYTAPAVTTAMVKSILFFNTSSSTEEKVIIYANAGTSRIVGVAVLPPKTSFMFKPEHPIYIENTGVLEAETTNATTVDYWISGSERATPGSGFIPKHLADGQLSNTKGTLYTVPGGKAAYVTIIALGLTASGETVKLYVKNATSRQILEINLSDPDYFHLCPLLVLDAGDLIEGESTSATTVDYWIDGAEE